MQQEDGKKADNVYENFDRNDQYGNKKIDCNTRGIHSSEHTESVGVKTRSSIAAAVCLVLLCFLLLTAVIVLCVTFTQDRQQLISKNENLTRERDQLKKEKSDLQKSREGWTCYQSSLYFISSEMKNWTESRRYCMEKGADLIIIKNREEQEFVNNISVRDAVWIGLTDSDEEGTWKWVDGSTLGAGYWRSGEPNSYMGVDEDCVVTSYGWNDTPCNGAFRWICEKTIF